ncbi:MAG: oxidoreductase [Candidatus Nephthysia bennettiae]|uniref:Aldo/keto reductase n=1 Tax=Candidatus Nephthysia bennettiae TaxID=3127016 RepID=A0A934K9L1_9BACT|nr:aldo/keto reductase [Candidatus Dormibacteraeota bacterium]MBJ7614602.1 aldo/keto reductase [Candidatus Dormibacteraeota bacterium]PZR98581.1 MAG: oxidoreductase [Candidatus Dormibacteraeota bacterium]
MKDTTAISAAAAGTITLGGDLSVNRMGFGAMRLTGPGIWGEPADPDECKRVLRRAVELDVTFIDTADAYGPQVSERLIAEALHPYPEGLVIATKGGLLRSGPGQWPPDGRPEHLREALEGSMRRLKLERIDLYQFHRPDPKVPIEESVGALADMQREGKIRHIGVSNFDVAQLERVRPVAPIVSVQNRYNLTDRSSEEVLQYCEGQDLAFIPWAPLGAGPLTESGGPLDRVADNHQATQGQIALAWLLQRSPVMLVIPGTSKVPHLEANVAAASIRLSPEELDTLDQA